MSPRSLVALPAGLLLLLGACGSEDSESCPACQAADSGFEQCELPEACPDLPDVGPCADAGRSEPDGGQGEGESDLGRGPDLGAGPALDAPERSCTTHLSFAPGYPAERVSVAGTWNDFVPQLLDDPDGDGRWELDLDLEPGVWPYKFVVRRGDGQPEEWRLDPVNAYRRHHNGVENSALRVPDCGVPRVELLHFAAGRDVGGLGRAEASLQVWRGRGGAELELAGLEVVLRTGTQRVVVPPDRLRVEAGGIVRVVLDGLAEGKHALRVSLADAGGAAAEPLNLPFWIEREPFSWDGGLLYMVMLDRFRNGRQDNDPAPDERAPPAADWQGGDIAGVTAALRDGSLQRLGTTAIWLSPLNTNPPGSYIDGEGERYVGAYHGYWPVEPRSIDARFGTPEDLHELVTEAHARGIRVMADLVLNHVHAEHVYMTEHPDWFRTGCVCGTDGCDWTGHRLDCLFNEYMPDVDWSHPEASEAFIADALWWLDTYDLDGFRVDAVKHVEDAAVFNLSTRIHEEFEAAGTEVFLLGETAMGWGGHVLESSLQDYATIGRYIGPRALNGQFDFVLFHAAAHRALGRPEESMIHVDYWTLASQREYPEYAVMTPYVGSHDTERLLSVAHYRGQDAEHPVDRAGNAWEELPEVPAEGEPYQRAELALTWLLTQPGLPLVYAGDEYGEFGGRDPDNRHMWRADEQRSGRERDLFERVARVGRVRAASPALRRGRYVSVLGTQDFLCYARTTDAETALVALNRSTQPTTQTLDVAPLLLSPGARLVDLLGGPGATCVEGEGCTVTLPPFGTAILVPAGDH